jgi:protein-S-isoprenylcysteine O-methyltransferase Ste14
VYLRMYRNINAIAIGQGKQGLTLALELIAFAGLVVYVAEIFTYALHAGFRIVPSILHQPFVDTLAVNIAGVCLIVMGFVFFILAFVSFGDSWRVGVDVKRPGALVTSGIFAYSRNPIYVFLALWFFGSFLINGTLIFLIFAVLATALLHWQTLQEERFLLKLYGKPYQDYLARTARYLFF